MRTPIAKGTTIEYRGLSATVEHDYGGSELLVLCEGTRQKWLWEFDGYTCSILKPAPESLSSLFNHCVEGANDLVKTVKSPQELVTLMDQSLSDLVGTLRERDENLARVIDEELSELQGSFYDQLYQKEQATAWLNWLKYKAKLFTVLNV